MADRLDQALVKCIADLAHTTPIAWREFQKVFAEFTAEAKDDCVRAPPEHIQVQQGRARGIAEVNDLFRNAEKTADRMAVRRNTAHNASQA